MDNVPFPGALEMAVWTFQARFGPLNRGSDGWAVRC